MDTRTGPAAQKLVDAIQEDIGEVVDLLTRARDRVTAIELAGRGINGLSATMKAKGNELQQTIRVLGEESEGIAKKMLHEPRRPAIKERVDHQKAAEVVAAKGA